MAFWNFLRGLKVVYLGTGLIILMALALLFLFMYPSYNERDRNISRVYFADNISPVHEKLIEKFNEQNSGEIEVVPINLPFSKFSTNERKELLARSLRSKSDLIDIFSVDLIWSPRFAKWVEPLDIYFTPSEQNEIMGRALESSFFNRKLVAIPFYIDVSIMYYRRDLLKRVPEYENLRKELQSSITWEKFISLKQHYFKKNDAFYIYPAKNYEGLICSFAELVIAQDQSDFSRESINLNSPESRRALNLLVNLVNKYGLTPAAVENFDEYQGYLYGLERDAVFIRGWPGFLENHRALIEETGKSGLFGVAATPHFEGTKPVSVLGGWNLMISKHSQNKWAAVKFLKYILQPETQKMLYEVGGYIPVNLKVYEDDAFLKLHEELRYYKTLLERGVHRPYTPEYTKISDILSYYIHLAIKQEMTPDAALEKASELIQADRFIIK